MKKNRSLTGWLFFAADAAVYLVAVYFVQLCNLLHYDHALSVAAYAASAAGCAGAVFLLALAYHRMESSTRPAFAALETVLFLAIALVPLLLLEGLPQKKGFSNYWMPTEWLKLPRAILFGARVSFPFLTAYAVILSVGFARWARGRAGIPMYLGLAVAAAMTFYCARLLGTDDRGRMYVIALGLPWVLTLVGIKLKSTRMVCRSLGVLLVVMAVLPFYFGIVPYFPNCPVLSRAICTVTPGCRMDFGNGPLAPAPGIRRLYPKPGESPEFPMSFLRQFYYDRGRRLLFSAYGQTCGFLRFDMRNNEMEVMEYRSLIRYVWSEDSLPYLLAPDWLTGDILVLDKDAFRITRRINRSDGIVRVPMAMIDTGDYLYLLSTELPAVEQYRKGTLERTRRVDFKALGLIPFSHGAYALALDNEKGWGFVQLGTYDLKSTFRLVRVGIPGLTVQASRFIRAGSVIMTALPQKNSVLMYDFYTRRVVEVDEKTLRVRRTFDGVLNCRNTVYDPSRDMLYMTGTGFGELAAVDYATGKIVKNFFVGNKAGSLVYLPEEDALLVGSGSGIYRVDLMKFTGIAKKALNR